jgi:hypothetical protein
MQRVGVGAPQQKQSREAALAFSSSIRDAMNATKGNQEDIPSAGSIADKRARGRFPHKFKRFAACGSELFRARTDGPRH